MKNQTSAAAMKKLIPVAITAVVLFGCSDTSHEPTNARTAQVAPSATAAAEASAAVFREGVIVSTQDFASPGVKLSITPNPYSACEFPKGEASVTIEYDARESGARHTQIWFQRSNGKQVLWGQAPGKMSANPTGNWAHEGMKVLLVEVNSGTLLAAATIHADACKQANDD